MMGRFLLRDDDNPIIDTRNREDDKRFTRGLFGDTMMISHNNGDDEIIEEEEEDEEMICLSSGWDRLRVRLRIPATIKEELHEGSSICSSSDHGIGGAGGGGGGNHIYVAVGKRSSSMDALRWTLKHLANSSSTVLYLIHVFPELRFIPSPLGMLPKEQVRPEQVNNHIALESEKRNLFIQKFIRLCNAYKVKVASPLLIESHDVARAIIDLVLILNIKQLVLGTTKSSLRKVRKANEKVGQIVKTVSDTCDIRIIHDEEELVDDDPTSISGRGSSFSKRSSGGGSSSSQRSSMSTNTSSNTIKDVLTHKEGNRGVLASLLHPSFTCFTIVNKFVYH